MDRRRFLKLTGLALLAAWLSPGSVLVPRGQKTSVQFSDRVFRADRYGRIFVSRDGGTTWQLHTYLGPEYWVRRLSTDRRGRMTARVGYRGRQFGLVLAPDGQSWRTV